jgi:hypothetical protein
MKKLLPFHLNQEVIRITTSMWGTSDVVYINLHENEQTAVEAAREVLCCTCGTLIELKSKGGRLISFGHDNQIYTFDPNRIFTRTGIQRTLKEYGPFSEMAAQIVGDLAATIIRQIQMHHPRLVVALHNTTGDYSIESYLAGGICENDMEDIFVNHSYSKADFFFTTSRSHFERIKEEKYNVILQHNKRMLDDGSLSVYCAGRIPYINVEALHGHRQEQLQMLEFINSTFNSGDLQMKASCA